MYAASGWMGVFQCSLKLAGAALLRRLLLKLFQSLILACIFTLATNVLCRCTFGYRLLVDHDGRDVTSWNLKHGIQQDGFDASTEPTSTNLTLNGLLGQCVQCTRSKLEVRLGKDEVMQSVRSHMKDRDNSNNSKIKLLTVVSRFARKEG
eukprot:m.239139 g.239139  ORF g.239139 m.239139 type:complete len:150 (-) comp15293_c0_seq1:2052-2501(-)